MMVKVFTHIGFDNLENALRVWLEENRGITVRFIAQSQEGGWVTFTIFYEYSR